MKLRDGLLALLLSSVTLNATTLKEVVVHTLENNKDIASKLYNNQAFKKYVDEQEGGYYPKLDLTGSLESKKLRDDTEEINYKGGNAQLDLEQLLYDGNLTPNLVGEAEANYYANTYKNLSDTESILYDSISAYLNILKFDERIKESKDNLTIHESYLNIATQTEQINGEILDKVQTKAKINSSRSSLYSEENNKNSAISSFAKNVGMSLDNNLELPVIDESLIPSSLDELYKLALKNNFTILEQMKTIEAQSAVVSQAKSGFLPTLKLKLQALYDDGLISEDIETSQYSGKVELTYNIFNGLIDSAKSEREVLFLKEAQAKLDVATKSLIDEITVSYNTYNTSKKQIEELSQLIEENKTIIEIYKDQFDAGTREFIDVLNVEADLYNSKVALISTKYEMYLAYYDILRNLSILKKSIASSDNKALNSIPKNEKTSSTTLAKGNIVEEMFESKNEEVSSKTENYALFLTTSKSISSIKKEMEKLQSTEDAQVAFTTNKNDTYTLVMKNLPNENEAMEMKNRLASSYPGLYYKKIN